MRAEDAALGSNTSVATYPPPQLPPEAAPRPYGVTLLVMLIALIITAAVTWTSWSLDHRNESHLLQLQTAQAREVVLAAIPNTQTPLMTAAEIAGASNGDVRKFTQFMATYVGTGRQFVAASLWTRDATGLRLLAAIDASTSAVTAPEASTFVARAFRSSTFIVTGILGSRHAHLGYAFAYSGTGGDFAVYAEHAIPADRRAQVATNSAFADLNYAIYLGDTERAKDLLTTSFGHLPVTGLHATVELPYGNTSLTMVTAPRGELGGTLPNELPWIAAVLGVLLSIAAAWTAERLVHRRRSAERDSREIRRLYAELGPLFVQQRTIAETLQHALLPHRLPDIPGLEIAVQYVAGATGVDIGGDWYSVISIDDDRFAFVVGDVSGRGVSAAAVMAAARFTIRAYATEGYSPEVILEKCSRHIDVLNDGHIATVLVGVVDSVRHDITLANAGHLSPLLLSGKEGSYLSTKVGVPLGVRNATYESVTVAVPPGSTMIAFTDGLIERRGESLDEGLQRLMESARAVDVDSSLEELLAKVVADLNDESSEDDIAILGLRWQN